MDYTLRVTDEQVLIFPGAIVVGDVSIGQRVNIWYNAVVRGDEGTISIGADTNVQDGTVIHANTVIGRGCTIGHAAVLHGCRIGDNSLIGMGSILLDGATIGNDCIVGAGSLVTGKFSCPDGMMILGNPARVVRPLTADERACNAQYAQDYLAMSRDFRAMSP